ncbi:hypothetical protein PISMIDRAFT_461028 [Pisolithus microcarpus 441]|uniref:Uncharacterized protein n=1 Tax=Pisolithus microcarpus 441 TaxID=765257 RepID=A0A0C9Z344_9AGAM|nr:hypothetical protein PISMIDRAFT_461028 [Pisolithus microcarpus 441]
MSTSTLTQLTLSPEPLTTPGSGSPSSVSPLQQEVSIVGLRLTCSSILWCKHWYPQLLFSSRLYPPRLVAIHRHTKYLPHFVTVPVACRGAGTTR